MLLVKFELRIILKFFQIIISLIKYVCIGTGREQNISSYLAQAECLIWKSQKTLRKAVCCFSQKIPKSYWRRYSDRKCSVF